MLTGLWDSRWIFEFHERVLQGEELGLVVGDVSQRDSVDAKCLLCGLVVDHDSRPARTRVSFGRAIDVDLDYHFPSFCT